MTSSGHITEVNNAGELDASVETKASPSQRTLRGLDLLNFFLADVQTGVGPFLAIYLAGYKWNEERVGLALTVGGIAWGEHPIAAASHWGYSIAYED